MDNLKPQLRRFQFSLRKLMLWMVVWGAYLALARWIGLDQPYGLILTLWLMVILFVRLKWGYSPKGRRVACHLTGFITVSWIAFLQLADLPDLRAEWLGRCSLLAVGWLIGYLVGFRRLPNRSLFRGRGELGRRLATNQETKGTKTAPSSES